MPTKPLTPKQQKLLDAVATLQEESLADYHGKSPEQMEEDQEYVREALDRYDKYILRAVKAGLGDHPLVRQQLAALDRNTLRRARIGLERGVKRPMTKKDLHLGGLIWREAEKRTKRDEFGFPVLLPKQTEVYRSLFNSKRLQRSMTREGFRKLVVRLALRTYFQD